jgi:hypothetical protein|tara:strand:- start:1 stop:498 length:498 start_codon:yes stop_codon:yes gene_type:complete
MNKETNFEHDVIIEHLLLEIEKKVAKRNIDIFRMQNENSYSEGRDSEYVNFLNESVYARPFSHFTILCTLEKRWTTIIEVSRKIRCNDKTARNLYQKAMDYDMIYRDTSRTKLCFKATPRAMKIYRNYIKALYCDQGDALADHLTDILQYMKYTKKHGTQYQVKR